MSSILMLINLNSTMTGRQGKHLFTSGCTSCCRCRVIVVSYTYEKCLLVVGVWGYNQRVQTHTHAHTQLHLVRVSLSRPYTAKINTTRGIYPVYWQYGHLQSQLTACTSVDLNAIPAVFPRLQVKTKSATEMKLWCAFICPFIHDVST